jgi:molybdopterin-guanine dinucleotide biosynthesis protein A
MGYRKELLIFPDGRISIDHALETLHQAVPNAPSIYISLNGQHQYEAIKSIFEDPPFDKDHGNRKSKNIAVYDKSPEQIGPAAGLLAVHEMLPHATILVVACDYPLLTVATLRQLIEDYKPPATYFVNTSGFLEPLLAIWSPEALEELKKNVEEGRFGLNGILKQMGGNAIRPGNDESIMGTNTAEEWQNAMYIITQQNLS